LALFLVSAGQVIYLLAADWNAEVARAQSRVQHDEDKFHHDTMSDA
jgi:hypothetical protein